MKTASGNPLDRLPAAALSHTELITFFAAHGQPAFRAEQVHRSTFKQGAVCWEEVRGLPKAIAEKMSAQLPLLSSRLVETRTSDDGTTKLALEMADGQVVESVIIPADDRYTLCLSTQAGCAVGCNFCASGISGLARNLERWEIVEQFIHAQKASNGKINQLVVMGIGEPLYNLDNVLNALNILQDEKGGGIGSRRIVLSTIGVIPAIEILLERRPPLPLAISLHAADDRIRKMMVPEKHNFGVTRILAAARNYQRVTGRQVTFEIVLVEGVNDNTIAAKEMAALLKGGGFFVNLLPCNPVRGLPSAPPLPDKVAAYAEHLSRVGISVQIRRPRGLGEAAACGQLRAARTTSS